MAEENEYIQELITARDRQIEDPSKRRDSPCLVARIDVMEIEALSPPKKEPQAMPGAPPEVITSFRLMS